MSEAQQLEAYLQRFRARLKQRLVARGAAATALAALVVSVLGAWFSVRTGFADDVVAGARLSLLFSLIFVSAIAWLGPLRKLRGSAIEDIEQRTPAFRGRVRTWAELSNDKHPLRELLAEDAQAVARRFPPERQLPEREWVAPTAVACACVIALVGLAAIGPGLLNHGLRHLWLGWTGIDVLPEQTITVAPQDVTVRRGGGLTIDAAMAGFLPTTATLHAQIGNAPWEAVEMIPREEGAFEFQFFSLREATNYYVSAAGLRSPTYRIEVADLPAIDEFRLTYEFPSWTGREPEVVEPGGDVRTVAGTRVLVELGLSGPLDGGVELVIDDSASSLATTPGAATGEFSVEEDGRYFLAARIGQEQVRLTDDYFIQVLEDGRPDIQLSRPGRDFNASAIEEVTAEVSARDDFRIESLQLRFAINGGDWQTVSLPAGERETKARHVFLLEALGEEGAGLKPGDLVSYYVEGRDRKHDARSDMFFIEIQPFERRFSQSQQSGGGMGGGGPGEQEISRRQKEIIVSTWNLLREQEDPETDSAKVADNGALLARLQETLAEQARTLAQRTRARQLVGADPTIETFVENLEAAAAAMVPASEHLAETEFQDAIQPEQQALRHLLRAEAAFTDVQLAFQNDSRGGGQAGRDLARMFDLEMDLEKNQYETGDRSASAGGNPERDEELAKLEELAQRQAQLAQELAGQSQPTPSQRWRQEMLQREVEALREQMAERQQQSQMSASETQSGSSGSGSEIEQRLESAARAMEEAMAEGGQPQDRERSAGEAQRQLAAAERMLQAERMEEASETVAALANRADGFADRQEDLAERVEEAVEQTLEKTEAERRFGRTTAAERELARDKRELQADVEALTADIRSAGRSLEDLPEAAAALEGAARELEESEVAQRLGVAAEYVEYGAAAYIVASESAVTRSLEETARRLNEAQEIAAAAAASGDRSPGESDEGLESLLAETERLRAMLAAQAQQEASAIGASEAAGMGDGTTGQSPSPQRIGNPDAVESQADATVRRIRAAIPTLRRRGSPAAEVEEIRRLARELQLTQFDGNAALLQREYDAALALVEQLELLLGGQRMTDGAVRSEYANAVAHEHEEAVAEYFRRLAEEEP